METSKKARVTQVQVIGAVADIVQCGLSTYKTIDVNDLRGTREDQPASH